MTIRARRDLAILPGRTGAGEYTRVRDLPRVVPLMDDELETPTLTCHVRLLALIRKALRHERSRGIGGHWTYDLGRHAALLAAYRAERSDVMQRLRRERGDGAHSMVALVGE